MYSRYSILKAFDTFLFSIHILLSFLILCLWLDFFVCLLSLYLVLLFWFVSAVPILSNWIELEQTKSDCFYRDKFFSSYGNNFYLFKLSLQISTGKKDFFYYLNNYKVTVKIKLAAPLTWLKPEERVSSIIYK